MTTTITFGLAVGVAAVVFLLASLLGSSSSASAKREGTEKLVEHWWETSWRGHRIGVKHWHNLSATEGGEELFIDGVSLHPGRKTPPRKYEDLYGTIEEDGVKHRVRAHIGAVEGSPEAKCLILVDGTPVGGDVDEKFTTLR